MKRFLFLIAFATLAVTARAQQIPAYSIKEIIARTSGPDTVYILNFWATWCAPCVQELPEFNELHRHYAGQPVKILMVSLDFKEDYPKLSRFLERKPLLPEVVWLSDTNPNEYIPKIDKGWQGSIPATVVVKPGDGYKKFIEGSVTTRQIKHIVDELLAD